ncbi:MAG: BrnA antitoxin family protein [Pseudomonadota bacterium]
MSKQQILEATKKTPKDGDYVWDGHKESDRPLSKSEMKKGIIGRPKSLNPKSLTTIRYSSEVIEYFRATGKGWQTRMNDVLQEYVNKHKNHSC